MMARRLAPARTLLAMGEVAAGVARRQQQARAEFGGRFADFACPAGQARIRALTEDRELTGRPDRPARKKQTA